MRLCVNCRQLGKTRKLAEELKVDYKDIAFIDEYIEQEEKPHFIVLKIPNREEIDWDLMTMYNEKLEGKFMLCIDWLAHAPMAKSKDIKFYWNSPVSTFFELNKLVELGAAQIILGVPLIFDKPGVEKLLGENTKLRLVPNATLTEYLIFDDGVRGGWIRPEDLVIWEDIAESCEFISDDLKNERVIFEIYNRRRWPDNLIHIIKGLNENFYSQYLTTDFGTNRSQCKQICQKNPTICRYCYRAKNITDNYKEREKIVKEKNS